MSEFERVGPGTTRVSGGFAVASAASTLPNAVKNKLAMAKVKEDDILHIECPLVYEGINKNGDEFLAAELTMAYGSIVGTPLDKDHSMAIDDIVGGYYDSRLETEGGSLVLVCNAFVWADLYPDVARKIASGVVDGMSMECKFEWAEKSLTKRTLHGVGFIGGGLVRLPAEDRARTKVVSAPTKKKVVYSNEQVEMAKAIAIKVIGEMRNGRS